KIVVGRVWSFRDVTELVKTADHMKLAKEKAEASDKLKTTFLNNISHEVRTPLNGILGFAEIISQTNLSDVDKKDSLSMLHESSDRLLNTITNYMDISLITSGSLSVYNKDFPPGQILKKMFDFYESMSANKNLKLILDLPEHSDDISVNSDPELIRKIISHLINNAVKFTEKGSIRYGYSINESNIEFYVKDTGIGIGKDSLDNIFDRFVKEDRGPLRITEGSGLGLSIAKGMIERIGGIIRVESELGTGSCFSFSIPLINTPDSSKFYPSDRVPGTFQKNILILVAEDDDTNFFYIKAILTREIQATILHAVNGRQAIDLYKANPGIHLILMDIKMPDVDGFEATREIKKLNPDIPIIAITAYAMLGDEDKILSAGCDGYLSKPISKKSLLEKIGEFMIS
ncbi:MAG: response regulator, partial [Bacteroidetes bacterium]